MSNCALVPCLYITLFLPGEPVLECPHTLLEYSQAYTRNALAKVLTPGREFHVSVRGDDRNAGTRPAPFKTLARARTAIRQRVSAPA